MAEPLFEDVAPASREHLKSLREPGEWLKA